MVTSCLFGILVFGSDITLIYRFLTNDFYTYLYKYFCEREYSFDGNNDNNEEVSFSVDDTIAQHFSTLLNYHTQTCSGKNPIKRVALESNIQVFFDQIGENKILCVADQSFNTLVVLKTINLFKSLVKFHIGAFPFTKCPIVNKSIDRISASLQYYLNNITTDQSLIFESSEHLHINSLIRQQCIDACTTVISSSQLSPTMTLITCKDKIVHMQLSNEQNRPSNGDIFLLLLNNTSRSLRTQFQLVDNNSFKTMTHMYKTQSDKNIQQNMTNSVTDSTELLSLSQERRAISLPIIPKLEEILTNDNGCIDIIFMKTSNRTLAPFTMYTIPLTHDISVLILVEWKNSSACSILSELIGQLNLCINQLQFSYKKLSNQVRAAENNSTIRRYFESKRSPSNALSSLLNQTQTIYKSLPKKTDGIDEEHQKGNQILANLTKLTNIAIDIFQKSFFDSDNNSDNSTNSLSPGRNVLDAPTIQNLQNKLFKQLGNWFSFIEVRAQANITISFCQREFPGLVHFALIDRSRGRICTPILFSDEYKHYLTTNIDSNELEHIKEKKIIAFELECLTALQRGCTSYTMTDEHFTYNYTLRLQESNGASMRLYKPFVKSEPPSVLHYDFYEKLAYENYASLVDQTSIMCFELICVHLRFVPPKIVRTHCEQLWPKLMELDEQT